MKRCIRMVALAALAWLLVQSRPAAAQKLSSDEEFVAKAISAQIGEIKMGETAVKHASSAEVKKFAERMVKDHTAFRDDLMEWAKKHKLAVVQGLEKDFKEKMSKLSKLKDADFDREYMKMMVADHKHDLTELQAHAKSTRDEDLRTLLNKTIPTVQEHLKMAERINGSLK